MRLRGAAILSILSVGALLGCGKKGPPLPPLVGSKPRITQMDLRQEGSTVRARFTMPIRSGSDTVDYRTKGIELWRREKVEPAEGEKPAPPKPRPVAVPGAEGDIEPGLPVGDFTKSAQLAQSITGDDLFELLASPSPELVDQVPAELYGKKLEYGIVLKTDIKSSGTVSDLGEITPVQPPAPPADVAATPTETSVRVSWTPASDENGKPLPVNVYRASSDVPFGAKPVNESPLASSPYEDVEAASAGATTRWLVRSVVPQAKPPLESDASPEVSATWKDVFPPKTPDGLRTFVDQGRVTLLWTPNDERDLLGYRVFRREAGGEWTALNETPVPSATYTDATAGTGAHEYAVSAVDRSEPPNESAKSAPVSAEVGAP